MTAPDARTLELEIAPGEVRRLLRHPVLAGIPRAGRGTPVQLTWHRAPDMPADQLACQSGDGWTLERAADRPPGALPRIPRHGVSADDVTDTPALLQEAGRFAGRRRLMQAGDRSICVLDGTLSGGPADVPCCRIRLRGLSCAEIGQLAAALPLRVPGATLGQAAAAHAGSATLPVPALGAPGIKDGSVLAAVDAIMGHLAGVVLHWAALVGTDADADGIAVHQARVGVRRLRSAIGVFRPVLGGAETDALAAPLKDAFARLGATRDWDVFLAGTGPDTVAAAPGDARLTTMLDQARLRQAAQRAELRTWLNGPAWRRLTVGLAAYAALRPWAAPRQPDQAALLAGTATAYARSVLRRIRRKTLHTDAVPSALPIEALHDLRKRCKRLRYGAEFFAPLFMGRRTRRFLRRLGDVQDIMGHLNDSAMAAGLMAQLGKDRSFAAGVVLGWTAAQRIQAQTGLDKAWKRLGAAEPFWT